MPLCGRFGISPNDFWTSTPHEFNGLIRGCLIKQQREASLIMPLYKTKRKIKLKDILGWELTDENEGMGTEKASPASILDSFESLDEKLEFKKSELQDLFDSFDDF